MIWLSKKFCICETVEDEQTEFKFISTNMYVHGVHKLFNGIFWDNFFWQNLADLAEKLSPLCKFGGAEYAPPPGKMLKIREILFENDEYLVKWHPFFSLFEMISLIFLILLLFQFNLWVLLHHVEFRAEHPFQHYIKIATQNIFNLTSKFISQFQQNWFCCAYWRHQNLKICFEITLS